MEIRDGNTCIFQKALRLVDLALPSGYQNSERLPKQRTVLKNCFNTGKYVISRPGITTVTLDDPLLAEGDQARGSFVWGNYIYAVYGSSIYQIDNPDTGASTQIDTISGDSPIDWAIGDNHAVIIVKGEDFGYTFDGTTATAISDPQFEASDSVTHIDGIFVFVPSDGGPVFFSDVGDGSSIQTDAFFDAEELPDKNKVAFNHRNILAIGGTDSFERFRNIGGTPVPFRRLNARLQYGYIGGIIEYSNTFAFIGREKDQNAGIYLIGSGDCPKISNEGIDTILSSYSETELSNIIAQRFKWRGYDILAYTLGSDSFGFTNGNWFILDSNGPWKAGYITEYNNKYYCVNGSKLSTHFGRLDRIGTDYGTAYERAIEGGYYNENNDDFVANSLELGISQGYSDSGTVGLQLSRDNVLYSEAYFRSTGDAGDYSDKLAWIYPGGLGYYEGFMGYRLSTTADIDFDVDKLSIK